MFPNDPSEDSTLAAELRPLEAGLPFLELQGRGPYGLKRLAFLQNPMPFTVIDENGVDHSWSAELNSDSQLLFRSDTASEAPQTRLLGQALEVGAERWVVLDTRLMPVHCLAGLSPELSYRSWPLGPGEWAIGRPGKRLNHVNLEHKSISRAHALIQIRDGTAAIKAESDGPLTAVNHQPLTLGESVPLRPNDLIQLGQLMFRWEVSGDSSSRGLTVELLGKIRIAHADVRSEPLIFTNEKARELFLRLVIARGNSLSVERILEDYWPERPVLRQRKNLSHILRALQAELGWSDPDYERWLVRTSDSLSLREESLESCDLWKLQDAVRQGGVPLEEALRLHPGALLPDLEQPWARGLRAETFLSWLHLLRSQQIPTERLPLLTDCITRSLRQGDYEEYVYREVILLAQEWGLASFTSLWMQELCAHLEASTGEAPSAELRSLLEPHGERS